MFENLSYVVRFKERSRRVGSSSQRRPTFGT